MPYELHIQRYPQPNGEGPIAFDDIADYDSLEDWTEEDPPSDFEDFERRRKAMAIGLEEWQAAVEATPGVRSAATGSGNAEVQIAGEWVPIFRWRADGIQFNALGEYYDDPDHPGRLAAAALARHLNAIINDDDFGFVHW